MKPYQMWAVVDAAGEIVISKCLSDGEENVEIHRTRKLAQGACMAGETVRAVIIEFKKSITPTESSSGEGPNALSDEGEISKPNKSEFKKRGAGQ